MEWRTGSGWRFQESADICRAPGQVQSTVCDVDGMSSCGATINIHGDVAAVWRFTDDDRNKPGAAAAAAAADVGGAVMWCSAVHTTVGVNLTQLPAVAARSPSRIERKIFRDVERSDR